VPRKIALPLYASHTKISRETTRVLKFFITHSLIQNKILQVFLRPKATCIAHLLFLIIIELIKEIIKEKPINEKDYY